MPLEQKRKKKIPFHFLWTRWHFTIKLVPPQFSTAVFQKKNFFFYQFGLILSGFILVRKLDLPGHGLSHYLASSLQSLLKRSSLRAFLHSVYTTTFVRHVFNRREEDSTYSEDHTCDDRSHRRYPLPPSKRKGLRRSLPNPTEWLNKLLPLNPILKFNSVPAHRLTS